MPLTFDLSLRTIPPMQSSSLLSSFPRYLHLAADARLTKTSYVDDQIWSLEVSGEPASLAVMTSYGLRATAMSVFPAFQWQGQTRVDPREFAVEPVLERGYPNYLKVSCQPFDLLAAELEWWVVESDVLLGRVSLTHLGENPGGHRLRVHAQLQPAQDGEPMGEHIIDGVNLLLGRAADVRPLLFVSGGPRPEQIAYPSLSIMHSPATGEPTRVVWALVSKREPREGFACARDWAGIDWERHIARLERVNSSWVQVECDDERWGAAFHASQQAGLASVVSGTRSLPHRSFVLRRGIDDGYSATGDGKDHPHRWSGQDVFAGFHLSRQIMRSAPEVVHEILLNYLHVRGSRGEVDARPGLAGQRVGNLCPPLLASLAWQLHRQRPDRDFLLRAYDTLKQHTLAWLRPSQDRDHDGVPEWDNVLQSGYPDSPTFVPWATWGQGLDISTAETPDLTAFLLCEFVSLAAMAKELGKSQEVADYEALSARLRQALDRAWDEESSRYLFLDRDTHVAGEGKRLGKRKGNFSLKVGKRFESEVRIVVRVRGPEMKASEGTVTIHGRGPKGQFRTEKLSKEDFRWFTEIGHGTTTHTFASIERVVSKGFAKEFTILVTTADHRRTELSQWLPLVSGSVSRERALRSVRDQLLTEAFWRGGGLPSLAAHDPAYDPDGRPETAGVRMWINSLIGQALVELGLRSEAADLVQRLMESCMASLEKKGAFASHYHPDTPMGIGEIGSIEGLAPLHLFLEVLGVRLMQGPVVEIRGINPFPWPVTVRWRGVTVNRPIQGPTGVGFDNGAVVWLEEDEEVRIQLEARDTRSER